MKPETFKFGDDRVVKKQKMIHIPVKIGERIVKLKNYVLPGSVPFLMEIEAMRGMKAKVDISQSNIELMGSIVQGRVNSGGHIVLELEAIFCDRLQYPVFNVKHHNDEFPNETKYLRKCKCTKPFKMQQLLENSSMFANMKKIKLHMLIDKAIEDCKICDDEKKQDGRPKKLSDESCLLQ